MVKIEATKRIEIIDDMSKRLVTFTHIGNVKLANEIARKWFKGDY